LYRPLCCKIQKRNSTIGVHVRRTISREKDMIIRTKTVTVTVIIGLSLRETGRKAENGVLVKLLYGSSHTRISPKAKSSDSGQSKGVSMESLQK